VGVGGVRVGGGGVGGGAGGGAALRGGGGRGGGGGKGRAARRSIAGSRHVVASRGAATALPQAARRCYTRTASVETRHGQGRDRLAGTGGQIQDREGFALSALRARGRARHHQRAIRAESAHRRIEALGAQERQRRVHQPRSLAHLQRLLRLRDRAGPETRAPAPPV